MIKSIKAKAVCQIVMDCFNRAAMKTRTAELEKG